MKNLQINARKTSPQGNGISGILFNILLENAVRRAKVKVIQNKPQILHPYSEEKKVSLPEEMIWTDDYDILSTDQSEKT